MEAQEAPKARPRPEKSDVENQCIFSVAFGRVGTSFSKVLGMIFGTKIRENSRSTNSSETSKCVIFLRENTIFQELEDTETKKNDAKIIAKLHAGSGFDFRGVSTGFGSGLGDQKS